MIGEILNTTPLTGEEATKDEVLKQLGSVALIHIAAHGDMEASKILLAPNITGTSKTPNNLQIEATRFSFHRFISETHVFVVTCYINYLSFVRRTIFLCN